MNFGTACRLKVKKPRWITRNLGHTVKAASKNVSGLKTWKKNSKLMVRKREQIMYFSTSSKFRRDAFGATILPSNLSFDNMKKLSMNQIKLEEIPLVDENEVAEMMAAEKESKAKVAEESKKSTNRENEGSTDVEKPEIKKVKLKMSADLQRTDPFEDIPGPRFFESLTSTLKYTTRHMTGFFILKLLHNGWTTPFRKYGPIVKLPGITGGRMLLVNRSEHITEIEEQDKRRPASSSLDTLEYSRLRRHGRRKKYAALSESDWEKTRQKINNFLVRDEEKFFDGLEESANHLIGRIRSMRNAENEVREDFVREINKWSIECLFHILFDKSPIFLDPESMKPRSKSTQLLDALRQATRSLNACENGLQLWRLMSTSSAVSLDAYCQSIEMILSHYVFQSQQDLLDKNDGEPLTVTEMMLKHGLTKTEVITNLLDMILIGMNSITNTLSFLLYHLAKNPRTQAEILKEIKNTLPETYSRLEYDHLRSLTYLRACLKETLRLKMPIPILTRYLSRDVIISNFQVPRGTFVVMAPQVEAIREENFEASREFLPSRWFKDENKYPNPTVPLSAYSRNSIDTRLAEISVMACTAQIIRNFKIEYNYGRLSATASPLSCPNKALKFSFLERER